MANATDPKPTIVSYKTRSQDGFVAPNQPNLAHIRWSILHPASSVIPCGVAQEKAAFIVIGECGLFNSTTMTGIITPFLIVAGS